MIPNFQCYQWEFQSSNHSIFLMYIYICIYIYMYILYFYIPWESPAYFSLSFYLINVLDTCRSFISSNFLLLMLQSCLNLFHCYFFSFNCSLCLYSWNYWDLEEAIYINRIYSLFFLSCLVFCFFFCLTACFKSVIDQFHLAVSKRILLYHPLLQFLPVQKVLWLFYL